MVDLRYAVRIFGEGTVLVCTLAYVMKCLCHKIWTWRDLQRSSGTCMSWASAIRETWRQCYDDGPHSLRAKVEMQEKRLQRMRTLAFCALPVFTVNGAYLLSASEERRWYTQSMDISFILMHFATVILNVFPTLWTPQTAKGFYSMCMAWLTLSVSPLTGVLPSEPMLAEVWFGCRLVLCVSILDVNLVVYWNILYAVMAWCHYAFFPVSQSCDYLPDMKQAAGKEALSCTLVSALCLSLQAAETVGIVQRLRAAASKSECRAVISLLNSMSDVVVKLDATLHVMEDSAKLAALLIRGSDGESVQGAPFERFLFADEDRKLFHDCIGGATDKDCQGIVPVRVHLRDGSGLRVRADLFHAELDDVAGNVVHLLGLREWQVEAESEQNVSRSGISRSAEWGPDLPPLPQQQTTMDAGAFLDALARAFDDDNRPGGASGRGRVSSNTNSIGSGSVAPSSIGSSVFTPAVSDFYPSEAFARTLQRHEVEL